MGSIVDYLLPEGSWFVYVPHEVPRYFYYGGFEFPRSRMPWLDFREGQHQPLLYPDDRWYGIRLMIHLGAIAWLVINVKPTILNYLAVENG